MVAALCNEWILTYTLSPDGKIAVSKRVVIWSFQITIAASGVLLILARNRLDAVTGWLRAVPCPGRMLVFILLIVGAAFFSGYVSGETRLHNTVFSVLLRTWAVVDDPEDPLGAPESPETSEGYAELNDFLDARLQEDYAKSDLWRRWMEAADASAGHATLAAIRTQLKTCFQRNPSTQVALHPRKRDWFAENGVDVSLVTLQTHTGVDLLCVLLIPVEIVRPAPCLLALHGVNGHPNAVVRDIDYHHGFAMALARNGWVVLAPFNPASSINSLNTLYTKCMAVGWNIDALHLHQLQRVVDYARSLDVVDPTHIGVYGISLGGQYALRLGALDERLSLVVCSGYFTDRFSWLFRRTTPSPSSPPGKRMTNSILPIDTVLYQSEMSLLYDDLNLVALIQPRFFCVETGIDDPRFEMAKQRFADVRRMYEYVGRTERARHIMFEGGHETRVDQVLPFVRLWATSRTDG